MLGQGIPLSWVFRHCAGVVAHGVPPDALFQACLIDRRFGDDRDQISFAQFGLLWLNAGLVVEDEGLGLTRKGMPLGFSTLALRVMLGCATVERAITSIIRFYKFAPVRFSLTFDGDEAILAAYSDDDDSGPNATIVEELHLTFLYGCLSLFLGRPLPVRMFQTRDRRHANLDGLHWATFAPVRYERLAALRFTKSILSAQRVTSGTDEVYWDMVRPWLMLSEAKSTLSEDRWVTVGDLRLDALAREAGVSLSTVRRQMTSTHGGFRLVRKKLLVEASTQLLTSCSRSVESIAAQLGYSDARSLRRFLKAATGKTPDALRAEGLRPQIGVLTPEIFDRARDAALRRSA